MADYTVVINEDDQTVTVQSEGTTANIYEGAPPNAGGDHNHNELYYTESEVDTALSGKSSTSHTHDYAESSHNHTESEINDLDKYTQAEADALLADKQDSATAFSGDYPDLTNKPTIPSVDEFETTTELNARDTANRNRDNHTGTQAISTVTGLQDSLDSKSNTTHNHDLDYADITHTHDDRYYTEGEVDTALSGKSDTTHTHTESDITDLGDYLESVDIADINATGTADDSTYLRGDGTWGTPAGEGGTSDHGSLTGLGDDDHTQYALADGTRGDFASTAQGSLADTSVQPADLSDVATSGSYNDLINTPTIPSDTGDLTNNAGYITDYTVTEGDVTAHETALSITESQISDLSHFSGSYTDLTNKPDLSSLNDVVVEANLAAFPATGDTDHVYIAEDSGYMYRWNGASYTQLTDQTAIWGDISGTLSNQTDIQNALDSKSATTHDHDGDYATTTHNHTESDITDLDHYDSTDFDTDLATKDSDDITEGATNLYLTSGERTKLTNTSGTNTGDEPNATDTTRGIVELATNTEASTGTDTERAVTPAGLKAVADTKSDTGHGHTASDISDFDTEVSNNSDVTANTAKVSYPGDASATELNILDGATLTTTELNYVDGVTSSIQTQLNTKLESSDISDFETTTELNARDTANRSRSNHTGTQTLSTISDAGTAAGINITVSATEPSSPSTGDLWVDTS